ncbi:MAG: IncI1 plasmid conjugative transfer protein TraU, partial [uncultured Paraburkholderia sp.]
MIDNLRVKMNGYMKRYGHSITFGFERDPDRSLDELMRLAEPQINAARRIGLNELTPRSWTLLQGVLWASIPKRRSSR